MFLSNGFFFTFITQLIACEQALRGSLAAGQEKGEAEHATLCSKRLDFLQSVNSFFFFRIMITITNYTNNYASTIYQNLEGAEKKEINREFTKSPKPAPSPL